MRPRNPSTVFNGARLKLALFLLLAAGTISVLLVAAGTIAAAPPPKLVSISVTPGNSSIDISGTQQFTAIGTYTDSSTADITDSTTWSSSDTIVATIDSSGLAAASGYGAGTTSVTAESNKVTSNAATLTVTKTFLKDQATDSTIWRVTDLPGLTTHAYYDISPWSPDGTRIAWSTETPEGTADIYVSETNGGTSERVVENTFFSFESGADPVWVSDTLLYFVDGAKRNLNVHAVALPSGEVSQVTGHEGFRKMNAIHLNADRTRMAYNYIKEAFGKRRFAISNINGELIREVFDPSGQLELFHPKWHPTDPDILLYRVRQNEQGLSELWLTNTLGTSTQFLTTFSDHPMWCPDGTCIVFNDYVGDPADQNARVHLIDIDGSNKREVVMDQAINTFHTHPTISPDGTTIIIDPRFDSVWYHHILTIDIATGAVTPQVSNAWTRDNIVRGDFWALHAHPAWNSDGSSILYAALKDEGGDESDVYVAFVEDIAPVATNATATTTEDIPVTIDVLANDTDVDGDPLTVTNLTQPTNGTTTLNVDNTVTYTPNAGFSGSDSFTYTANDGIADSNVATVSVTVNAVNDAPVATNDTATTTEDIPVTIAVLANDTDADGDPLTVTNLTQPTNGTATLNPDNTVTYTPNPDFNGSDSVTYTANDGITDSNVATVSVTVNAVNDAPVANDDTAATTEDIPVPIAVLANDTDVDGDPLTATNLTQPTNGTTTLNVDNTVTYTPNAGFTGSDSFTYTANDGTADSNVATVAVTVNRVNDAAVATNDTATTTEDIPVTIAVLANDTDADGDPLTVTNLTQPTNGTATLNPDDTVTYTPNPDFHGSDSFTYTANDGIADSNVATVSVTVDAVNDAPVATNDAATTTEDTPVTIAVLANDTDVDGDPLTVTNLTQPANGTTTLTVDNTVTYAPNAGFSGSDSFTYTANDSTVDSNVATVSVTVNATPAGNANDMYVWDIVFLSRTRKGGAIHDERIRVTVRSDSDADGVTEDTDAPVADATVTVELRDSAGGLVASLSGTTNANGVFTGGKVQDLSDDTYVAEVMALSHGTFVWNQGLDPTVNDTDVDADGFPDQEHSIPHP